MGQKNLGIKKLVSQKIFGLIDLNPKFVLSKEKTGRVNPRWRIYDPPPPKKIVGLKLCWITNYWVDYFFRSINFMGPKKFCVEKKLGQKNYCVK